MLKLSWAVLSVYYFFFFFNVFQVFGARVGFGVEDKISFAV